MSKRKPTQNALDSDENPLGFMSGKQTKKASDAEDTAQSSTSLENDSKPEENLERSGQELPTDRIRRTYSVARQTDERLENLQERLINILFHKVGPTAVKDVSKSTVLDTAVAFFNEYAGHEQVEDFVADRFNKHA